MLIGMLNEGFVMQTRSAVHVMGLALAAGLLLSVSGCASWVGDMGPVNKASELAIDCKTDEALAQLDAVPFEKNLASAMGDLTRVVILRDAGRTAAAEAAQAEKNKHWHVDEKGAAESEKSTAEAVEKFREERLKKTGKRTCH